MRHNAEVMDNATPIHFTRIEVESYLPSGWTLPAGDSIGDWDADAGCWRGRVTDGVDFDWPLEVSAAAVQEKGRQAALKDAIDGVHRGRLGKPTRGLGLGSKI